MLSWAGCLIVGGGLFFLTNSVFDIYSVPQILQVLKIVIEIAPIMVVLFIAVILITFSKGVWHLEDQYLIQKVGNVEIDRINLATVADWRCRRELSVVGFWWIIIPRNCGTKFKLFWWTLELRKDKRKAMVGPLRRFEKDSIIALINSYSLEKK